MEQTEQYYNAIRASKYLHCTDHSVICYLKQGKLNGEKIGRDWVISKTELDRFVAEHGKQDQLCNICGNACGGCSWSREFIPVKGWKAEKTKIMTQHSEEIESYYVIDCPLYKPDTPIRTKDITDDGMYRLLNAMLLNMIWEYAYAYKRIHIDRREVGPSMRIMKETEAYVKSPFFGEMLGVLKLQTSGEDMLRMVREDPLGVIKRVGALGHRNKVRKDIRE